MDLQPIGKDYGPVIIPAVAADLITQTCRVYLIHLVNKSASPVTITIKDKQGAPLDVLQALSVPANTDVLRDFGLHGRLCPGGVNWVAGTADAVVGFIRARV